MTIHKKLAALAAAASLLLFSLPVQSFSANEPYYTVTAPISEENGVLTIDNGEKWYKVNSFEDENDYIICVNGTDGKQVMLTASDDSTNEYVWHFYRRILVTNTAPRLTQLYSSSFQLTCHDDQLYAISNWWNDGDSVWSYSGGTLSYKSGDDIRYLRYSENSSTPFDFTDNAEEAAQVSIYAKGQQLSRCISGQPAADSYVIEGSGYKAPVFSVTLSDKSIITDSIRWFTDGREQSCTELTFTADGLKDQPAGVHHVSCLIEGHDADGFYYREKSAEAAFIIAKGVIPNSFMSFSDIHEEYDLIGSAAEKIIERTGGYIPSLVVCSGDLVHGPTVDKDTMLSYYYPRIVSALGGLDTVFVSGNHDSGEAASIMSASARLGAERSPSAPCGQIFKGTSEAAEKNGKNSRFAKGITVYGLNFDAAAYYRNGEYSYSYDRVIDELESFLKKTAEDYHGELVVISAHSGLHVLGVQPDSVNSRGTSIGKWIGENQYNVDRSYDLANLINSYAEKYNMDILYLFGHDHSRQEEEFILSDGDVLLSTKSYSDMSYGALPLSFTYGHSGYLSTSIGNARAHFSFIYQDGDKYVYDILSTEGEEILHREIPAKSEFKEPLVTTASTAAASAPVSTAKNSDSPKTGDSSGLISIAFPAALLALVLSMRKKPKQ